MVSYQGGDTPRFQSIWQDYLENVIDRSELLDLRRADLYPVR